MYTGRPSQLFGVLSSRRRGHRSSRTDCHNYPSVSELIPARHLEETVFPVECWFWLLCRGCRSESGRPVLVIGKRSIRPNGIRSVYKCTPDLRDNVLRRVLDTRLSYTEQLLGGRKLCPPATSLPISGLIYMTPFCLSELRWGVRTAVSWCGGARCPAWTGRRIARDDSRCTRLVEEWLLRRSGRRPL